MLAQRRRTDIAFRVLVPYSSFSMRIGHGTKASRRGTRLAARSTISYKGKCAVPRFAPRQIANGDIVDAERRRFALRYIRECRTRKGSLSIDNVDYV